MEVIEERKEEFVPVRLRMISPSEVVEVRNALGEYIKHHDILEQNALHRAYSKLLCISMKWR